MESAEATVKFASHLDEAYQLGANTVILAIEYVLNRRPHHADFAMDRVIHGVLESIHTNILELANLTPHKDAVNAQLSKTSEQ